MATTPGSDVIEFWFGSADGAIPPAETRQRWWKKDPAFDAEIQRRFGDLHAQACRGELDDWADTPRGALALIILLDQFSRNLHRGDPRSWAHDDKALALARRVITEGKDRELSTFERAFVYMPLMHAEDLPAQEECIEQMKGLAEDASSEDEKKTFASNVDYARQHRDIVARFGRFPHRNEILGRETTEEEREFLTKPGSSF
jgi:uncharacterized protein (DUF924 family)